ncbi:hypothetical protein EJD97_025244 [Solanum chilense]|uniref:Protein yippee-like n=1 Tax=Solanum chilense TaxID=4083 RepID=A0A6N2ARK7_SOLCI|nr:hypothetical protein EJD97_025244 [Solanum chilense]
MVWVHSTLPRPRLYDYTGPHLDIGFAQLSEEAKLNHLTAEACFLIRVEWISLCHGWVNITYGEAEERTLLSGMHTVMDIFCVRCGQIVGWKYVKSHEESQKYKEGKFVLEGIKIVEGEFDSEFYIDTRSSSSDDEDGDTV